MAILKRLMSLCVASLPASILFVVAYKDGRGTTAGLLLTGLIVFAPMTLFYVFLLPMQASTKLRSSGFYFAAIVSYFLGLAGLYAFPVFTALAQRFLADPGPRFGVTWLGTLLLIGVGFLEFASIGFLTIYGHYRMALRIANFLLWLHPFLRVSLWWQRGTIHETLNDFPAALNDYDEAIQRNGDYSQAYIRRAFTYLSLKNFEAAHEDIDVVLSLTNTALDRALLNTNHGIIYTAEGKYAAATEFFEAALTIPLDGLQQKVAHARIYYSVGILYFVKQEYPQAIQYFEQADNFLPEQFEALSGLSIAQYKAGQKNNALARWSALIAKERRFTDAEWVKNHYYRWTPAMADVARQIIADLNAAPHF